MRGVPGDIGSPIQGSPFPAFDAPGERPDKLPRPTAFSSGPAVYIFFISFRLQRLFRHLFQHHSPTIFFSIRYRQLGQSIQRGSFQNGQDRHCDIESCLGKDFGDVVILSSPYFGAEY